MRSNLREELNLIWFTVLEGTLVMGEKVWLQEKVTAGNIASAIRKLRTVKPGVQIIFYSTYYPRQGDGAAHI